MEKRISLRIQNNSLWIIIFFVFLLCFVSVELYVNGMLDYTADSDSSSELVLAQLLSQEHAILTPNWYYSTELRVLNTNLVFTPLFCIFKSWHNIRMTGTVIIHVILLLSAWWLCRVLKAKRFFPIAGLMLITPLSYDYYNVVLRFPYYAPHVAISLVSFTLMVLFTQSAGNTRNGRSLLFFGFFFSLLAGLGGARQLAVTFLPLFGSTFVMWIFSIIIKKSSNQITHWKKCLIYSILMLTGGGMGYLVNTNILVRYYHFYVYEVHFVPFDLTRLVNLIKSFFIVFGKTEVNWRITSRINYYASYFLPLISFYCSMRSIFKKEKDFSSQLALFYIASIVVFILLYCFTDMDFERRYWIPFIGIAGAVIACDLSSRYSSNKPGIISIALVWMSLLIVSGFDYLNYRPIATEKSSFQIIADYLCNNDYTYGYSTFWNGNVLTELSDGKIIIHNFAKTIGETNGDINRTQQWLQLVSHDTEIPQKKVFLVLEENEINYVQKNEGNGFWNLDKNKIILTVNNYSIYGYDSHEAMIQSLHN